MHNNHFQEIFPFAVIGSKKYIKTDKEIIRGRKYPWGCINIDNPTHCDIFTLRKFLFE